MDGDAPASAVPDAVREKRLREQALAQQVYPFLVEQFKARIDPAAAAEATEARFAMDSRTAYRWAALVYDELERSRRRIAGLCAAIMWIGALLLVVLGVGAVTGRVDLQSPSPSVIAGGISGAILLCGGLVAGFSARRFARLR